ncbi:peptidyl-tRNA hydrolase, PTH2 family [Nematocida minor]|uniref:peptidyl-tRNA hydrolase, PTH2 family n=1 Tax=Nematocida minor TaxID=1912983 RepID=UPI00221E559E|nr:peptidyl-tRNA hydrolase, PTH2 family [Nematocida minor]KAI5189240.1 peptidyl-tRNA hydrolase, PTH2 family [Nematocida minor]
MNLLVTLLLAQAGVIVYLLATRKQKNAQKHAVSASAHDNRPVKGVLLVRSDLKMGKGKIVAQAMHAAYEAARKPNTVSEQWKSNGFKKVSLSVPSKEELDVIIEKARKCKVPTISITDAGRTQVEPNTHTVSFLGPWYEDEIDSITGNLKLL